MRKSPGLEKSLQFLRQIIDKYRTEKQFVLPAVRSMASRADVCTATLTKAIRILKKESVVRGHAKSRLQIIERNAAAPEPSFSRHLPERAKKRIFGKWTALKQRIVKEIIENDFAQGKPLPGMAQLQSRYGVCFTTLKKTLTSLAAEGYLEPFKKTFRPRLVISSAAQLRFLCFIPLTSLRRFFIPPRTQELLRTLEKQRPARGIGFDIAAYDSGSSRLELLDGSLNPLGQSVLASHAGYFFVRSIEFIANPSDIVLLLGSEGKPLAILDEIGPDTAYARHGKNTMLFPMAWTAAPAHRLARLLMTLGHRSVVFISAYHRTHWSAMRLKGIQEGFAEAGFHDAVKSCVFTEYETRWGLPDITHPDWPRGRRVFSAALLKVRRMGDPLLTSVSDTLDPLIAEAFMNVREVNAEQPLFESALGYADATAWVCANDMIAIAALDFLRRKGKRVPHDISVVGFDDTTEALMAGLSSYNFDFERAASAMISFLISPGVPFPATRVYETDGFVVERSTTAEAPRG